VNSTTSSCVSATASAAPTCDAACATTSAPCSAWSAKLHADKGYDYDHLRQWLRSLRITPRIARKGVDSSARLGRHRWTVERTVSWLGSVRRLHRWYERKADHFLAFAGIATIHIRYGRLTT
jgi:IS5 family transposase